MLIIISPSKSMKNIERFEDYKNKIKIKKNTIDILDEIKKKDREEISQKMKIKNKLLDEFISNYRNFENLNEYTALSLYQGAVFKQLDLEKYDVAALLYTAKHLRIISAFYGVLKPFDLIRNYRLDMNSSSLLGFNLYDLWQEEIDSEFSKEKCIVNLASKEFSKSINNNNMINFRFLVSKNNTLKEQSYNSKMLRGKVLDFMIKNKIQKIDDIMKFTYMGSKFTKIDENNYEFIKVE